MSEQGCPLRGKHGQPQVGVVPFAGRRGAWTAHKLLSRRRRAAGSRGVMSRHPGGIDVG